MPREWVNGPPSLCMVAVVSTIRGVEAEISRVHQLRADPRAHNLLVGGDVEIDPSVRIGANVVINSGVRIGPGALIKNNCVIGELPSLARDSKARPAEAAITTISASVTICNGVVIFAGAELGQGTIVGDQAYVREGVTTAEDVVIGRACNIGADANIGAPDEDPGRQLRDAENVDRRRCLHRRAGWGRDRSFDGARRRARSSDDGSTSRLQNRFVRLPAPRHRGRRAGFCRCRRRRARIGRPVLEGRRRTGARDRRGRTLLSDGWRPEVA